jgi:hypothetical protein
MHTLLKDLLEFRNRELQILSARAHTGRNAPEKTFNNRPHFPLGIFAAQT